MTLKLTLSGLQTVKKIAAVAGLILTLACGALDRTHAASVQPYQQEAFDAAQKSGGPTLVFVEASWCPTCAKERPILKNLHEAAEFAHLQVFDVDFDVSKLLLRRLNVQMQNTLIVYRDGKETGRLTGPTDPDVIKRLLEPTVS